MISPASRESIGATRFGKWQVDAIPLPPRDIPVNGIAAVAAAAADAAATANASIDAAASATTPPRPEETLEYWTNTLENSTKIPETKNTKNNKKNTKNTKNTKKRV